MSQRTVAGLARDGLLCRRLSALGTPSYVLTRPGATFLELRGFTAHHGLDLNVSGSGYRHHAITTRFVLEMEKIGYVGWHEYAIAQGAGPLTQRELLECYGKLPDAILIHQETGRLFLVEVEGAPKSTEEISRACAVVTKVGHQLHRDHKHKLGGLIFVFDKELAHAARIERVASSRWRDFSVSERQALGRRITLCRLALSPPLVLQSYSLDPLNL